MMGPQTPTDPLQPAIAAAVLLLVSRTASQTASAAQPTLPVTNVSTPAYKKADRKQTISKLLWTVILALKEGKRDTAIFLVKQLHQSSVFKEKEVAGLIFSYLYHHMTIAGKRKMDSLQYGEKTFFGESGFNEANDQDRVIAVKRAHVRILLDTAIQQLEIGNVEKATTQFVKLETLATTSGDNNLINRLFYHMWVAKGSPENVGPSFGSDQLYSDTTPASEKLKAIQAYKEELAQKREAARKK